MSNNCEFHLRAVSDDKNALHKLIGIVKGEDHDHILFRLKQVNNIGEVDSFKASNGKTLFTVDIHGYVAWSSIYWFVGSKYDGKNAVIGYHKDENGFDNFDRPIYSTAKFTAFPEICKKFGIGVEIFASEEEMGVNEHYHIDRLGKLKISEPKRIPSLSFDRFCSDEAIFGIV